MDAPTPNAGSGYSGCCRACEATSKTSAVRPRPLLCPPNCSYRRCAGVSSTAGQHQSADPDDPAAEGEPACELGQPVPVRVLIVVQVGDDPPGGGVQPGIARPGQAGSLLDDVPQRNAVRPGRPAAAHQLGHPVVGRGVVHHDDLEVRVVLAEHRRQAAVQPIGAVPGADHHAGGRRVQQRCRPADQVRRRPGQPKARCRTAPEGRRRPQPQRRGCHRCWRAPQRPAPAARCSASPRAEHRALTCCSTDSQSAWATWPASAAPSCSGMSTTASGSLYQRASTRADSWPGAVMPHTGSLSSTSQTLTGCKLIAPPPAQGPLRATLPGGTRPPTGSRRRSRPRPWRNRR